MASTLLSPEQELEQLKHLLLKEERVELARLSQLLAQIEDKAALAELVAEVLPEAIAKRSKQDDEIAETLGPHIGAALQESIRHNNQPLIDAIFPILGPIIRKNIAESFNNLVQNINEMVENSLSFKSLRWRWEAYRTGRSFAEVAVLRSLDFHVEQVFLIHRETSLLLQHVQSDRAVIQDPDIVSSMLSAVEDFVNDSFQVNGGNRLQSLRLGELHLMIEQGPHAVVAAVVMGFTPPVSLQETLHEVVEKVHKKFATELLEFSGDPAPFELSQVYLREALISKAKQDKDAAEGANKRKWTLIGFVLALISALSIWGYWAWVEHTRQAQESQLWQHTVQQIEQMPGYVITDTHTWPNYQIQGMKDPLAPQLTTFIEPEALEQLGVQTQWMPYKSLADRYVQQRRFAQIEDLLTPPDSVTLDLKANRLTLSGVAPEAWAKHLPQRLEWVKRLHSPIDIDLSELEIVFDYAQAYQQAKQQIELTRLYFDLGRTSLSVANKVLLNAVSANLNRLFPYAQALSKNVKIQIIGYTDTMGSQEKNLQVSSGRVESVVQFLAQQHFLPAQFEMIARPAEQSVWKNTKDPLERKVEFKIIEF